MQITRKVGAVFLACGGLALVPPATPAQTRHAADLSAIPLQPPVERYMIVDAFPGLTFSSPLSLETPPGETNRLFVAERAGRLMVITNLAAPHAAIPFLDITNRVLDDGREFSLKGFGFHPGYATNGFFYVTYCHTNTTVRLSRFTRDPSDGNAADPASELVLIEQPLDYIFHNFNDVVFGPDGYLYMGAGDEGQPGISNPNAQVITQDLWSAILRIDPDKRPGSLEPNPHPSIPTNASGAFFAIPPDNPFIGATQFNGIAVNPATVRTEFYAVGFRNPWQFSFDPDTGDLWAGDVGDLTRESVRIVTPGLNAGWPYYEGKIPGPAVAPTGFVHHPPVWDYPHDIGPFSGSAVIGGLVLRAGRYPELEGLYLCIDHLSGHLWTIERSAGETNVTRIAGQGGIVQMALDPASGDVLFADHNAGLIRRLVEVTNTIAFPQKLSDTGLFADLATLTPSTGVVPYEINLPFWSDYAAKRRWFAISNLVDGFGYARDEPWTTPPGAMWIKHFDLDLERFNTNTRRRVETRLLVRMTNGVYGVSYRWNEAGSEAYLVPDMGDLVDLPITNTGIQRWTIPSRAECVVCHRPEAGHALGFNTRQLNREGTLSGVDGNFIDLLSGAGYFTNTPDTPALLPRHVRPTETNFPLEVRARSYLAVNCGYCHQGPGSIAGAEWDGRAQTLLEAAGLVRAIPLGNAGNTNNLLLAPGDETHSVILNRIAAANGFSRMPPLASSMLDYDGIQLVANWINQQLPGWQSYADWRLARFGSTNSPAGEPDADPDDDARSNWEEYLTYSNPTNDASYWTGEIALGPGGVEIGYELFNRAVFVETSPDLLTWTPWAVAGNNGMPLASGLVARFTVAAPPTNAFYRFRIEPR